VRWSWFVALAVVELLVVVPVFPGRANHDTDAMFREMVAEQYTDWWSPVLMALWRPFHELGFGIGFILAGQTAVLFAAVGSLVSPLFRRRWSAIAVTIVICLWPTTYAMLINVIRDTWFTVAVVAGLAVVFRARSPTAIHGSLLAASLVVIMAARQNGVLTLLALSFAAAAHWGLLRARSRTRRVALWGALAVVGVLLSLVAVEAMKGVISVQASGPETATFFVDLDELSTRSGTMLIPAAYRLDDVTIGDLAIERNYLAVELNFLTPSRRKGSGFDCPPTCVTRPVTHGSTRYGSTRMRTSRLAGSCSPVRRGGAGRRPRRTTPPPERADCSMLVRCVSANSRRATCRRSANPTSAGAESCTDRGSTSRSLRPQSWCEGGAGLL
jgi:hypothetical protein